MSSRSVSQEPVKDLDAPEASTSRSTSSGHQEDGNSQDYGHQDNDHQREPLEEGNNNKDEDSAENGYHEGNREDQEKTADEKDGAASADAPNHTPASQGDWQAIWAPAQNAYYFYNMRTNETTWTNPLQPQSTNGDGAADADSSAYPVASTSTAAHAAQAAAAAAEAAGIDPSLAYLDPSLGLPTNMPAGTFTAKFNARTGAFTRMDARDPSHLSEAERAKRMSQVYFDVAAWEQEVEERTLQEAVEAADGSGKKRKRPTKKDLERFKEQKRLKKIAKTAWLRT